MVMTSPWPLCGTWIREGCARRPCQVLTLTFRTVSGVEAACCWQCASAGSRGIDEVQILLEGIHNVTQACISCCCLLGPYNHGRVVILPNDREACSFGENPNSCSLTFVAV